MPIWCRTHVIDASKLVINNRRILPAGMLLFLLLLGGMIESGCKQKRCSPNQTIIYDLCLGMPKDSTINKLGIYARDGRLRSSKTFLSFETEFDLNGQIGEISIEPLYDKGRLSVIVFEMCYKAWAPWNRNMFATNVVPALMESNDLWPGIVFKTRDNTWISKYRGFRMEITEKDEKYIKGKIMH